MALEHVGGFADVVVDADEYEVLGFDHSVLP
jgi:hypothetical protein